MIMNKHTRTRMRMHALRDTVDNQMQAYLSEMSESHVNMLLKSGADWIWTKHTPVH